MYVIELNNDRPRTRRVNLSTKLDENFVISEVDRGVTRPLFFQRLNEAHDTLADLDGYLRKKRIVWAKLPGVSWRSTHGS